MRIQKIDVSLLAFVLCFGAMAFALLPANATAEIGKAAPNFSAPDVMTNKNVTLQSLLSTSKAVVLIYISTQCPYSNGYNARFQALADKYGPLGVSVVGINSNSTESPQDVVEHAMEHHFTFQVLKDGNNIVADKYGASHTPEAYLINDKGILVYHGRIDNSVELDEVKTHDLANAIDEVLAGKPVVNPETKAFGCSIKRVGF